MANFNAVSVTSLVSGAQSVKTGISFIIGKAADGKDAKASFRLDGAYVSEGAVLAELDRLERLNADKPVSARTVVRMSLPKLGGATLTLSIRPVYTPGGLADALRTLILHVPAPETTEAAPVKAAPRKGKASKETTEAAPVADVIPATV